MGEQTQNQGGDRNSALLKDGGPPKKGRNSRGQVERVERLSVMKGEL